MSVERTYEFKLASGKRVVWSGASPADAARRFVDCVDREAVVVAWRDWPRFGLSVGLPAQILEPGDPGWEK